ncbi:MAG TPA: asparagine synthase, partial [Treponema sp.]|nr:asparagine synthase [Treponema sp.]
LEVPEKLPMSRPADEWLKGWQGPERPEFIPGCVACLSGEQKLLVYSLERFLNLLDRRERA